MLCFSDPHFQVFGVLQKPKNVCSMFIESPKAMSMQIRSHSPVFPTYSDLGYVQVLCLLTQHWHIKRRQIRREERLSDSCLPGRVTLLRDPLRGAQPWVTSVPQSGRKTSNTRPVQPPPLLQLPLLLFSWAPRGISEDHPSSHHAMNQPRLSSCCHHAPLLSLFCSLIYTYCQPGHVNEGRNVEKI